MSSYNAIYRDVFNFHKERAMCLRNTDEFWRETLSIMETLFEAHGRSEMCADMLLAVFSELERRVQ